MATDGGDGHAAHASKENSGRAVWPACVPENGRKVPAIQTSRPREQPSRRPGRPDRECWLSLLPSPLPIARSGHLGPSPPAGFVPIAVRVHRFPGSDDGDNSAPRHRRTPVHALLLYYRIAMYEWTLPRFERRVYVYDASASDEPLVSVVIGALSEGPRWGETICLCAQGPAISCVARRMCSGDPTATETRGRATPLFLSSSAAGGKRPHGDFRAAALAGHQSRSPKFRRAHRRHCSNHQHLHCVILAVRECEDSHSRSHSRPKSHHPDPATQNKNKCSTEDDKTH